MHIGVRNIIEFKALCTLKFKRIFLSLDKLLSKNWICTYHKFTLRRHLSKCTKLKTTLWHYLPSRLYQFQSDLIPMNDKLCLKVPEWGIKTSWWQKQGWLLEKKLQRKVPFGISMYQRCIILSVQNFSCEIKTRFKELLSQLTESMLLNSSLKVD